MSAKVYFFPHPFTTERREETAPAGVTLASIVKTARSDIPRGLMVRTFVNGTLISADKRPTTILRDDDEIVVRIVPANGGTDRETASNWKQIGGIASVLAGIGMFVLGLATGGMAWVALGFIVIGGLVSTVGAGLTASGVIGGPYADEMGTTNHPSIRGASNTSNPNGKVPLVLGKHLLTPGYLCPPYTVVSGTDGIDQYLYMVFVLGYGPLTVSQIQFGETLVATNAANITEGAIACDGVLPGCEVEIRQDAGAGTGLTLFPKEVIEQNFQTALNRYHDLSLSGKTITVSATARSFYCSAIDWTDTTQDIRVGDNICFAGFANAANNGDFIVSAVSAHTIYCHGVSTLVDETDATVTAHAMSASIQTTAKHTTSIAVTITFPKLCKYKNDGSPTTAQVTVIPYYRLKGTQAWSTLGTFVGSSLNMFTKAKAETLRYTATSGTLTAGQYEVMVLRWTADSTDSTVQDAVYWTSLRSHTGLDIMPAMYRKKVTILGVKVKASEAVQNCITKLNCIVAADYSYIATADAAHDWASIIASNPQNAALAYVHACMGPGNPRPRTAAQMDWASIFALATWCDTLKGTGANQYRVEVNGIITQSMKLSALINEILAPARASLTMSEGTYGVVFDAVQSTPKQHIGPHNSWGFQGKKAFGETIHGYRIKFVNADEQYTVDERIVLDDGYKYDTEQDGVLRDCWGVDKSADATVLEATKFESIEAALDTNPAQVFGWGRYMLAVRRLRPELFTVNMDAENLAVKRGELVKVSHPAPRWGLADGRLTAVTLDVGDNITAVTTDNTLTMETGKAYAVRFRTAAGTSIYRTVTLAVGDTHDLTLDTAIPDGEDIPAVGDWFGFGIAGIETIDCIVAGVDLNDDLSAKLTLFEAAPSVHTADTGAIPAFDSKVSFGPQASAPSTTSPVYPPAPDVIPYPATKALTTLTDAVDFDGQYGVYLGQRYIGTMPTTWALDDAGQTAAQVVAAVPVYAPQYLGAVKDGFPASAKDGDVYLLYSETANTVTPPTLADPPDHRGVFKYASSAWAWTTDPADILKAARDIVEICLLMDTADPPAALYGTEAEYGITTSINVAHIKAAIIDILRAGDVHIEGTLTSPVLDTIPATDGSTINAPTPTYWPGSALITLCASLADGWHAVDSVSTLDSKNITHAVKGGVDNSISYQASDTEVTGSGSILKTITSAVKGKVRVYFDYYGSGRLALLINTWPTILYVMDIVSAYTTYYVDIEVSVGDSLSITSYDDWGAAYVKNFRICPSPNTIGLWNNTNDTAVSIDNTKYYTEVGTVNINAGTLDTSAIDDYWPGAGLIADFIAKVSPYKEIPVDGGTFNSKTCSSIYLAGSNSIQITFSDTTTLLILSAGYYIYTGSITLADIEGKILLGDEDNEGQYELWSHNIPGTTDNIQTVRNIKTGKPFSIWETRAPDASTGNDSESTFSLHGVVGTDDYVHDHSMHNYSGEMHFVDGFYNYGGDHVGDWKKVAKRVLASWQPSTSYQYGDLVQNGGNAYVCTYFGTSNSSGGPTGTNAKIDDSGCVWRYVGTVADNIWEFLALSFYSQSGAIKTAGGRIPSGKISGTVTDDNIYQAIAARCRSGYLANYETELIISGVIDLTSISYCTVGVQSISFSGMCDGISDTITVYAGGTTSRNVSLAW